MGQAVVTSGTPMYLDQLIPMDGVTAPVAHFPMAGWHQGMYGQQLVLWAKLRHLASPRLATWRSPGGDQKFLERGGETWRFTQQSR